MVCCQEWSLLPPGPVDNITTAYDDAILTLNEGVQDFKDDFLTPVGDSIMASFDSDALESMGNAITSSLDSFAIDAMDAIKQSFDPGNLDAVRGIFPFPGESSEYMGRRRVGSDRGAVGWMVTGR